MVNLAQKKEQQVEDANITRSAIVAFEIERKFLVKGDAWRGLAEPLRIRQGYVPTKDSTMVRVRHVRVLGVPGTDRVAHPLLVPPHLVHAVVVATAERNSSAVEVAMEEKGAEGVLSAGRVAVDANAGEMPPLRHSTPGPLVPPPEMC